MTVLHAEITPASGMPEAQEANPPVVLLGSLGSTLEMWRPQIDALSRTRQVVALDHRGHGDSPVVPGPCTVAELAADVIETLDAHQIGTVDVAGLSLGGAVAQYLAATSGRVRRLALLCTAAKFGEPSGWVERAATARTQGMEALADAVVSRWFSPQWTEANPEQVSTYRSMIAATPSEGYAASCEALSTWDFRDRLHEITVPVLTIAGADDPATPPSTLAEITDQVAHGYGSVLNPAAHLPTIEQKEEVTRLLQEQFTG